MKIKQEMMPIYNLSIISLKNEEWRDCLGFDGIYSISNLGRVKSERRYSCNGKLIKERILKQCISNGTPTVKFSVNNIKVTKDPMRLVGEVFLGIKKEGEEYCHKNKIKIDNRLCNIIITTKSLSSKIAYNVGVKSDWGIGELSKKSKQKHSDIFDIFENGKLVRRICSCCFVELDLVNFYLRSEDNKYNIKCKDCTNKQSGVKNVGLYKRTKELANSGLRYCSTCKELKNLDIDFNNQKNSFMGKCNQCKDCTKIKNEKYRILNKIFDNSKNITYI